MCSLSKAQSSALSAADIEALLRDWWRVQALIHETERQAAHRDSLVAVEPYRARGTEPSNRTYTGALKLIEDPDYQQARALTVAFHRLDTRDQWVLVQRYVEGRSYKWIAQTLRQPKDDGRVQAWIAALVEHLVRETNRYLAGVHRLKRRKETDE